MQITAVHWAVLEMQKHRAVKKQFHLESSAVCQQKMWTNSDTDVHMLLGALVYAKKTVYTQNFNTTQHGV